jgi:hypothetical protein
VANNNNPLGFQPTGPRGGNPTNYAQSFRKIRNANATAIYRGDPVNWGTTSDAGYIVQGTAGTTVPSAGIFWGCKFYSTTGKIIQESQFWPGSGASGDATAYVMNLPLGQFLVQSGNSSGAATPVAASQVGLNADFAIGTGSTVNGQSGAYLDVTTIANTATLPFHIVQLASDVVIAGGAQGVDSTSPYNWVIVEYNPLVLPA